jgi:hypothetical protein
MQPFIYNEAAHAAPRSAKRQKYRLKQSYVKNRSKIKIKYHPRGLALTPLAFLGFVVEPSSARRRLIIQ